MHLPRTVATKMDKFSLFSGLAHQKITSLSFNQRFALPERGGAFLEWV
jgi:hypothetical protein